jgi:alkylation response protein AidB-like acyl-CoA dehydrogenase
MDFRYTSGEERFRDEVRQWLGENLPPGWGTTCKEPSDEAGRMAFRLDWERRLARGGWTGIAWSKDYGGRGATLIEQAIFLEELARAKAPDGINIIGRNLTGPTLIAHGSDAQKRRFLPPLLAAEEIWCQGFSEPNAGSDLAAVQCKAVRDGDAFVVNGQKIWTSFAQYAHWCILLVRTDSTAPRHRGISFLLVDMKTPGITIRPLVQITGDTEFSEVFYDDVRVPAEHLVGGLNDGWRIAMTTLTFERGPEEALARQVRFHQDVQAIFDLARRTHRGGRVLADDPVVRQQLARSYIEVELMRLNCLRSFTRRLQGRELGPEASFSKLYWSHMYQRMMETALELEGPLAALAPGDPLAPADGIFAHQFLQSRAVTIYSGTSEIQRNIIAERVLGLPRGGDRA